MCGFEISTVRYKSCKLLDYGGLGWTVQPHTITSTYIHQCEDPKPKHGSASIYCDERLHTERVKVTDSGDRGHTMVTGECPACKAADEKCREVFTIPNPKAPVRKSDTVEPTESQPPVEQNPLNQIPPVEQSKAAEAVTNNTTESKKKPHPRQAASAKGQQTGHGR